MSHNFRKNALNITLAGMIIAILIVILTGQPLVIRAQGTLTDTVYDSISYETITVSSVAVGISAGVLTVSGNAADKCLVTTESQPLRYTTNGTTPTASVGHLAAAGSELVFNGRPDLASLRFIRTGTDATVQVTCSRRTTP
jgi:hypothetical protein